MERNFVHSSMLAASRPAPWTCPGCYAMGSGMMGAMWIMMVLITLLAAAVIAALVALAIFLVRRSRHGDHRPSAT